MLQQGLFVLISDFWQFRHSNFSWWHYYIEGLQNNKQKENRLILCVHTKWKGMKRCRTLIHKMITKQRVKNKQIKRKQTCSLCFVNVFKFQENKFMIVQKNFKEIKIILIKIRFLRKATSQNDHYMIDMGDQRPKIGINWPLTSPYLQHCIYIYTHNWIMDEKGKYFWIRQNVEIQIMPREGDST